MPRLPRRTRPRRRWRPHRGAARRCGVPRRWWWCCPSSAAAWAGLQLYGLARTPFYTKGEPREAIVVQDLVRHGNWILPRRNAVQLPRKPPLFYWLAGAVAKVRGAVDEVSVRLPSALLSGAACLLVAGVATVLYGGVAGAAAGLTLLTSFEWLRAAIVARVDMTLAFGLTLVFVGLLMCRRSERSLWLLLVYGGCAWATLSKGIPGLAIPDPAGAVALSARRPQSRASPGACARSAGCWRCSIVCGSWYVAAALQGGRSFVTIALNENFVRAVGGRDFSLGHEHSVLATWSDRSLPACCPGRCCCRAWPGRCGATAAPSTAATRACSRCCGSRSCSRPYAFATSKRGVYLLPLYPAVSLLLGWWVAELLHGRVAGRWLRPGAGGVRLGAGGGQRDCWR